MDKIENLLTIICTPTDERTPEQEKIFNEWAIENEIDKIPFDPELLRQLQDAHDRTPEMWERFKAKLDSHKLMKEQ